MRGAKKQTESSILSAVRQYLRLKGWFVIRIQQGLGCHKGISDLIALKDGQNTLWIEVKTETGRLSEFQEWFQMDITNHGGTYVVVRSLEDIRMMMG